MPIPTPHKIDVISNGVISNLQYKLVSAYSYYLNGATFINLMTKADWDFKYKGQTDKLNMLTDYVVAGELLKLYIYVRSINTSVNSWNDFVAKFVLEDTVSKIKCNGINIASMVSHIDAHFDSNDNYIM